VWEFERDGDAVRIDPTGPLRARPGAASDLLIQGALAEMGVVHIYDELLRPHFDLGGLVPILKDWEQPSVAPSSISRGDGTCPRRYALSWTS